MGLAAGQQCDDESKCDIACPDGSNECWKQASSASLPDGPLPPIYIDMYDPGTYPSLSVWWECWQPGSCPDTFNWIENAPALLGIVRFDKETMTLTVIKPRVLYQKKGGYEVKKGSFNKGAAKEKECAFASGFAYKGKVPEFGGEGTLKEYPEEYKKIFPMTRGGLLAAGQQCDDESKC